MTSQHLLIPSSVPSPFRGPSPITLSAQWLRSHDHSRLFYDLSRPLTKLRVLFIHTSIAVLLLSRDTSALLVSTLAVYILPLFFLLVSRPAPGVFFTPMFSDVSSYHMTNYATPNPLSHSFCLLAVYTCTWETKNKG